MPRPGFRQGFLRTFSAPVPDLPTADLFAHWDFSDISTLWKDTGRTSAVTADADTILGVTDLSGNAHHLSEATNGPTYKTGIQNGKSIGRFDGVNDLLTAASSGLTGTNTFYIVAKAPALPASNQTLYFLGDTGYSNHFGIYDTSNTDQYGAVTATSRRVTGVLTPDTSWHVHCFEQKTTGEWYTDGVQGTWNGSPGTVSWTGLTVASLAAAAQSALDCGEILIYNAVSHDATTRQGVEANLKAKWGTP